MIVSAWWMIQWSFIILLLFLVACTPISTQGGTTMKITSSAFKQGETIPEKYTCQGKNISPPLEIQDIPQMTKSLTIIMADPDAPGGTWDHWIMWNMPPDTKTIKENTVPTGAVQGLNSWGKNEYGGPCPPTGTHRYYFKIYSLDAMLDIPSNSKKKDLENAMRGHIIESAEIVGLYKKK